MSVEAASSSRVSLVGSCALSVQPLELQRLHKDGALLADDKRLVDLNIKSGDILALAHKVVGSVCCSLQPLFCKGCLQDRPRMPSV